MVARSCRLNLELQSGLVSPWFSPATGHVTLQKSPMRPHFIVHWEHLSDNSNPFVAWVAELNFCICMGVVRFAHAQRSCFAKMCPEVALLKCSLGKSRSGGARAPYYWILPKRGVLNTDVGERLYSKWQKMRDQLSLSHSPGYLLPNFLPAKSGIGDVRSVTNKAMSYSRFARLSR
eukprot:12417245-Karenia_brevis.AAC.1